MKKILILVALAVGGLPVVAMGLMMLGSIPPSQRCVAPDSRTSQVAIAPSSGAWTAPYGSDYDVNPEYPSYPGHTGVDINGPTNAGNILAAGAGTVTVTDLGDASYGLYVRIDHGGGFVTLYAHLSSTVVKTGDTVRPGQKIAVEGGTGNVTGPHLHFETRVNNAPRNPFSEMKKRGIDLRAGKAGVMPPAEATGPDGRLALGLASQAPRRRLPGPPAQRIGDAADIFDGKPAGIDRSADLNAEQLRNAQIVIQEGRKAGLPPRAWAIALITMLQESNGKNDPSPDENKDVGLFQQREELAWYADEMSRKANRAVLLDPAYAARTFYLGHDVASQAYVAAVTKGVEPAGPPNYHIPGLVDVEGWQEMPLWEAAADVQRPAEQYRVYYRKHEATAAALLANADLRVPTGQQLSCPGDSDRALASRSGVTVPLAGSTAGEKVVSAALTQLGQPYSWGGGSYRGPSAGLCCSPGGQDARSIVGFDCSGLTRYAWYQGAGIKLGQVAADQERETENVPRGQVQAGDLLFFPGHVGIYDGRGGMIHAPRPNKKVEVIADVFDDSYYGSRLTKIGRPKVD